YYTNMKQLWNELACLNPPAMCTYGRCICESNKAKVEEIEASQLIQFLTGLNESYDNIRNQILVLDLLPHVNKAFSMVLRVERQRQVNLSLIDSGDSSALLGRGYDFRVPEWYKELTDQKKKNGNGSGGWAYTVTQGISGNSVDVPTVGRHLVADLMEALKLIQAKVPQDPIHIHFAQGDEMAGTIFNTKLASLNNGTWIVDTGATNHLCGDVSLFHSLQTLKTPININLPDNSTVLAKQSGNITLSATLTLTNDLKTKTVLVIGKQVGKLYYLDRHSFILASATFCNNAHVASSSSSSQLYVLWHKRLGHPNSSVLSHIPVLQLNDTDGDQICSVCPLAKQPRISFSLSDMHTCKPFDLMHIDIWGPYKQPSLSGCHFVLTVVDDYSRVTWTFLLHPKSHAIPTMSSFLTKVSTQFEAKVRVIRTDNGSEFLSLSFQTLLQTHGIEHHKTCTYTPQQNGVVERKHRHLLQVARALMFESDLPRDFWADSILTATHIINKLPSYTENLLTNCYTTLHPHMTI
ncbi:UNVERIFIED_CONTAM: Copia protein, partial [Sesamum latifolium]